jgi:hypothetical protein
MDCCGAVSRPIQHALELVHCPRDADEDAATQRAGQEERDPGW